MNAFFWWLLNIGVPIAGPVCMLGLFSVTHGKGLARLLIYESLKGGQLLWSAIAISATAIYESATALERQAGPAPIFELAIAAFLMIAFTCSMLVMLVTLKQHDDRALALVCRGTQGAPWPLSTGMRLPEDATVSTSVWLTGAAALLFGALHTIVS